MAIGGMEQMMVAVLQKMGLNPDELKAMALGVQKIAQDCGARLERIEALQLEILEYVKPKPAGGFELGDGSLEDIAFREGMGDVIHPLPSAETLEYAKRHIEKLEVISYTEGVTNRIEV
jgi:hypothetical protein